MDETSKADSAAGWTVSWLAAGGEASRPVAEVADVGFEAVAAVREFPSYRGQRHFPGWYYAATLDAHVGFESWLERDLIRTIRRVIKIADCDLIRSLTVFAK